MVADKYYVLIVGDGGTGLYELPTAKDLKGFMGDLADDGDGPEIKTLVRDLRFDESGWAIVFKGQIVKPKVKVVQSTELVWEAEWQNPS